MTTIVTRAGKGSPLTWDEADANFNNLNVDKVEVSDLAANTGASTVGYTLGAIGSADVTVEAKLQNIVSVLDFGAVGDGTTDDTAAIQAAFDHIIIDTTSGITTSGALSTSYSGTSPRLFFPKGTYKITSTLTIGSYLEVYGDSAIIKQDTDSEDIFDGIAYQWKFNGIQFVGGRYHVNLYNDNINSTLVEFEKCQFFLSRSYAINTSATGGVYSHLSTNLSISGCRFITCNKVINNCCDSTTFTDCWIQVEKSNFDISTAAFLNKGTTVGDPDALTRLHLKDCFLIPVMGVEGVDRLDSVRWIDNYGTFSATHCRFGGEDAGMQILNQLAGYNTTFPWISTEAIFRECTLYAGPDSRSDSCVVGIQGYIPNRIVIHNCTGPVGNPLIANLSSLNIPTYMSGFESATSRKAIDYFKIDIRDSINDINAQSPARSYIPSDLYPYLQGTHETRFEKTAQSIPNGFTSQIVSFSGSSFDNAGGWDATTPTYINLPKGCTRALIIVNVDMNTGGVAKIMKISLIDSGGTVIAGVDEYYSINADIDRISFSTTVSGTFGSYWNIEIKHNAASALTMDKCNVSIIPLDSVR